MTVAGEATAAPWTCSYCLPDSEEGHARCTGTPVKPCACASANHGRPSPPRAVDDAGGDLGTARLVCDEPGCSQTFLNGHGLGPHRRKHARARAERAEREAKRDETARWQESAARRQRTIEGKAELAGAATRLAEKDAEPTEPEPDFDLATWTLRALLGSAGRWIHLGRVELRVTDDGDLEGRIVR